MPRESPALSMLQGDGRAWVSDGQTRTKGTQEGQHSRSALGLPRIEDLPLPRPQGQGCLGMSASRMCRDKLAPPTPVLQMG